MNGMNVNLEIAKEAEQIKLKDTTGLMTIEIALELAKKNLNRLHALNTIIKELRGDKDD